MSTVIDHGVRLRRPFRDSTDGLLAVPVLERQPGPLVEILLGLGEALREETGLDPLIRISRLAILAARGGRAVGFAVGALWDDPEFEAWDDPVVCSVWVARRYRRRGIATELAERLAIEFMQPLDECRPASPITGAGARLYSSLSLGSALGVSINLSNWPVRARVEAGLEGAS